MQNVIEHQDIKGFFVVVFFFINIRNDSFTVFHSASAKFCELLLCSSLWQ